MRRDCDDPFVLTGSRGSLAIQSDDEVGIKLAMLIEGECGPLGPSQAALKYGFSRQRYYQLRHAFGQGGSLALQSRPSGPKSNYRRTPRAVQEVIRHRFLDPDASADVIAQKLRQCGWQISTRSVERVLCEYGLKKKGFSGPAPAS